MFVAKAKIEKQWHSQRLSNSQYGIAGSEFTARAELVEAHSPFDKLRANGDSPK